MLQCYIEVLANTSKPVPKYLSTSTKSFVSLVKQFFLLITLLTHNIPTHPALNSHETIIRRFRTQNSRLQKYVQHFTKQLE